VFKEDFMLAIASNITTRNRVVSKTLKLRPAESISQKAADRVKKERIDFLQELASDCIEAGADILDINLQQRYDEPEIMKFAVETVQGAVDCQLCLSSNRADTLEAGLRACKRPAIVNYVSLDSEKLKNILPLIARYKAEVILVVSSPTALNSTEDILKAAAVLVGAANESGISNKRIIIDPGVLHVTSDAGQRHAKTLLELLPAFSEIFDPPIRTTAWINNVSAGAPRRLRPVINNAFLAMLSGVGLSSVFVDALDRGTMRTVRLIRILRDDAIYSDRDVELC
jgi:5-methyltetrahydrofolate corrinoid/iron sulfur protein methyltransferase